MPSLTWASKTPPQPAPGNLELDSLVFPQSSGYPHAPAEDLLILGENLAIMSALLPDWEGRLQCIYADPPFFTNRRFPARVGRGEDSRKPHEWQLSEGYPDDWEGIDAYLDMLYPRLHLMHRLLAPSGTLYLHLDWHANHYARLLLDEIFGPDRLLNEIVWVYHGPSPIRTAFNRKHDTILVYTKSKDYTFNADAVREPYNPSTIKTFASSPRAGFGKVPDLERGKVPEDWWYFPVVARLHNERTGYPTQKPEALLERIVLASSHPGDVVADFFCGSGTLPAVAARLGRRYIAADAAQRAVFTTRARLVSQASRPFQLLRQSALMAEQEQLLLPGEVQLQSGTIVLSTDLLERIDYWEVDPHWDGKTFRSALQAVRRPGKKTLPGCLALPDAPGSLRPAVRLVYVDGLQHQYIL